MQYLLSLVLMLVIVAASAQQTFIPKHTYKLRLRTMDNNLRRGIISSINDSTITLLWHDSTVTYSYTEIKKITIFRKGTGGKLMLVTVPLSIAGGLAISRNQPVPNRSTRWLNNTAAVNLGVASGMVKAAVIGRVLRKTFIVEGKSGAFSNFQKWLLSR